MRENGGNRYNHGFVQGKEDKASTLYASGSGSGETYMGSQAVSDVAKRSQVHARHDGGLAVRVSTRC